MENIVENPEKSSLENLFANALLSSGTKELETKVQEELKKLENSVKDEIKTINKSLKDRLTKLEDKVKVSPIEVNFGTVEKPQIELTHSCFDKILKVLQSAKRINKNIMLVGPCGSGKNIITEQVAHALNIDYYPISVGGMTTKSDLIGFVSAKGDYITTNIRRAYENGGICAIDEFDSSNPNVATILNALLANDIYTFPDKTIKKHENFICIVMCNTYGRGGSVEYIGRNRLDSATLDRFITITMDYDTNLEIALTQNSKWMRCVNKVRENIKKHGVNVIVSPRASMQGADLLEAGFKIEEVMDMVIYKGVNDDTKKNINRRN